MGKKGEDGACVDTDFRVRGIENLRVVDLSIIPLLPKYVAHKHAISPLLTKQQPYAVNGLSSWRNSGREVYCRIRPRPDGVASTLTGASKL
jgi:hypothetical protein